MHDSNIHGYITFGWLATILFALTAGALYHSQYTSIQQSTEYADKCAKQYQELATGTSNVAAPTGSQETDNSNPKNEGEPDWCDLAAQQSMAESTRGMHWAAWATVAFTGFGAFLIWRTLIATQDTVTETRRIGEAQLRAYVVPEKCMLDYEDGRPIATIIFRNSGGSPADNIAIAASLTLNRAPVSVYMVVRRDELMPKAALGPGGETTVMAVLHAKETAEGLSDGLLYVIAGGSVEYTDIFRRKWRRSFIFNAGPANGGRPKPGEMPPGNKYLPERFVGIEKDPGKEG